MKTSLLLVLFSLTICFSSFAQNSKKLDSLINVSQNLPESNEKADVIDQIIQTELYSNPEKAKDYINEMIALSKSINYKIGEAKGYHRMAGYYFNQDKLDSTEIYFKKSRTINNNINHLQGLVNDNEQLGLLYGRKKEFDTAFFYLNKNIHLFKNRDSTSAEVEETFKFIGSTYHSLANIYTFLGSFNLALKSELIAAKLYKRTEDPLFIADANNSLGSIESELGNHEKALTYLKKASETYKEHNDVFFQMLSMMNIGVALQGLNKHNEAIEIYKESIKLCEENNFKGREALLWANMGNSYDKIEKNDDALRCFQNSIKIYTKLKQTLEIPGTYNNIGRFYTKINKLDSAMVYLNKAIAISDSTNFLKISSRAYLHRSSAFKKLNNYRRSLEDFEMHAKLKDSMFNEQKSKQIEELRTIYETEKKEQQIEIQKNEIDILNIKGRVNNLQRLLLGLALLLALIAAYAFFQRSKRHKLEKEKANIDLEYKTKELTTHALHLAKKNEVLSDLKNKAKALKADTDSDPGYQMLIQTINFDLQDDANWENFSRYFEEVHKDFNKKAQQKYPAITSNDLRLMALLKMNLSSKEIANILNISIAGIKKARNRLRKKLDISPQDSLEALIISI